MAGSNAGLSTLQQTMVGEAQTVEQFVDLLKLEQNSLRGGDTDALAAYAEHPEHLRVRRALGDMRIARHQVDYEIQPEAGRDCADHDIASTQQGDKDHVQTV